MSKNNLFVITCPACGYSFKKKKGKKVICPMCGHEIKNKYPSPLDEDDSFKRRIV